MSTREVTVNGQEYVVETGTDELRVGRRTAGEVEWLPETVPTASIPEGVDDDVALQGVITAMVERGG